MWMYTLLPVVASNYSIMMSPLDGPAGKAVDGPRLPWRFFFIVTGRY